MEHIFGALSFVLISNQTLSQVISMIVTKLLEILVGDLPKKLTDIKAQLGEVFALCFPWGLLIDLSRLEKIV